MLTYKKEAECCAAGLALDYFDENPQPPQPKRTKCFSFPAQPSHIASLPPPSSPGSLYLTYKEKEIWNETTSIEGKKDTYELELMLAEERKLWQREKHQLQLKNIELENQIDMKKNELEHCCKELQHMRENEKLHSEIIELKDQLQAKQAVNEDFEAQKKIKALDVKGEGAGAY